MRLRTGIPLLSELDAHLSGDDFRRHVEFNREFLAGNDAAMDKYGKLWAKDTFRLWSRRWEYPFVAERVIAHAQQTQSTQTPAQHSEANPSDAKPSDAKPADAKPPSDEAYRVLDAGSGVTYFPYYLCREIGPGCEATCFDSNLTYHAMFKQINANPANTAASKVKFVEGMLQEMPFEANYFDAVCCISVLEHTSNYSEILDEFNRVLKPGGVLVITFDLSLDGRFELPRDTAEKLLRELEKKFDLPEHSGSLIPELDGMKSPDQSGILTTDHFRKTQPDLLPWKYPMIQAVKDLAYGHGWTGGFRSKSVYCVDVVAKA